MRKIIILITLLFITILGFSQTQIYQQGGAVFIEKSTEKYSINAGHFDWRKSGSVYIARDGIQQMDIKLGNISQIYDKDSLLLDSENALNIYLNQLVNKTDVLISDNASPMLVYTFSQKLNSVTLAYSLTRGSDSLTLVAGHNATVGDCLEFWESVFYFQTPVAAISGNQLTLEKIIPYSFTTNSTVERTCTDLNQDGSANQIEFSFAPYGNNSYDIYEVSAIITSTQESDDSKFGGIAALTNGLLVGKINPTEIYDSYPYNFKKNADFKLNSFNVEYTSKAGGGQYGTDLKKLFPETAGVITRVKPGQKVIIINRDNLSTLPTFNVGLIGHIVVD